MGEKISPTSRDITWSKLLNFVGMSMEGSAVTWQEEDGKGFDRPALMQVPRLRKYAGLSSPEARTLLRLSAGGVVRIQEPKRSRMDGG